MNQQLILNTEIMKIKKTIPQNTFDEINRAKELIKIISNSKDELKKLGYDIKNITF